MSVNIASAQLVNKRIQGVRETIAWYLKAHPDAEEVALFSDDYKYLTDSFESTDLDYNGVSLLAA